MLTEVPGAVEPAAGALAEGVGQEGFSRQVAALEVAPPDAFAADVELAGGADGGGPQLPVEQVDAHVGDGPTDGRAAALVPACLDRRTDAGFGRPVGVEEPSAAAPLLDDFGRAGFPG